jgi:hypothetical protein
MYAAAWIKLADVLTFTVVRRRLQPVFCTEPDPFVWLTARVQAVGVTGGFGAMSDGGFSPESRARKQVAR